MKFGKSYMETLASPSFPKEWREGAIEYKQLKKLINGVVAELESLGLGADVLRDLIVPPDEQGLKSDSEEDDPIEDLKDFEIDDVDVADDGDSSADNNLLHPARSRSMHRRSSAPASSLVNRSLSHDNHTSSMGSSADDCEECATDLQHHRALQSGKHSDSPAAEWVAHISHAQHSRKTRRKRAMTKPIVRPTSSSSVDTPASVDETKVEYLRLPKPRLHSGAYSEGGMNTSEDERGAFARSPSAKLNKRDLEELRKQRPSTSIDGNASGRPSMKSTTSGDRIHDWGGHAWRERAGLQPQAASRLADKAKKGGPVKWVQGKDGRRARAEYELGGTADRPIPHIRLFVESPVQSGDELEDGGEADSEGGEGIDDEEDEEDAGEDDDRFIELGSSVPRRPSDDAIKPLQGQPRSPILRGGSSSDQKKKMRSREIIIPLSADTEFLDTLTGALGNLSALQETQREQFQQSTEALTKAVSQAASPYANKNDLYAWREIFSLWCELQIFESQREKDRGELSVDETEARLKKFADELAKRGWNTEAFAQDASQRAAMASALSTKGGSKKFAGKLAKWRSGNSTGASGALPMKDPRSIAALEDFLKLNLALLDVKKFQRVNVEAARKILKKHDKRTALTASSDLGAFVAEQEHMRATAASAAAGVGISGLVNIPEHSIASNQALIKSHGAATHPSLAALLPSSTTALMSSSLPHILLSLMTTTLLPILPSIDDYSCAICTGVAWRPIKLDCEHLFCIRCLVKLQKQGKNDCPLCRAKNVVGSADERNLDKDAIQFLKEWFPREVAEKEKENEKDRHKEEMLELGIALENEKCTIA